MSALDMPFEHYGLCGVSVAVVRDETGGPLIVTSALARGLGIKASARIAFDSAARQRGLLQRVPVDHGKKRSMVDAVSLSAIDQYVEIMWRGHSIAGPSAESRLWEFRFRLTRAIKKSTKSKASAPSPRATLQKTAKTACAASGPILAMSPRFSSGTPFKPLLKTIVNGVCVDG